MKCRARDPGGQNSGWFDSADGEIIQTVKHAGQPVRGYRRRQ